MTSSTTSPHSAMFPLIETDAVLANQIAFTAEVGFHALSVMPLKDCLMRNGARLRRHHGLKYRRCYTKKETPYTVIYVFEIISDINFNNSPLFERLSKVDK